MPLAIVIGLVTGLVSALLFASASTGTALGLFVLFFLSPLPVAIAGLGWGWLTAIVACVTAALAILVIGAPQQAAFHALTIGAPTAVLAYYILLNRDAGGIGPDGQPDVEWYPLGRVVAMAALWAGVLATLALITTATDVEGIRAAVRGTIERLIKSGSVPVPGTKGGTIGDAEIDAMATLMTLSMPGILATVWMVIATLNLWLAGHATRFSGRLARPWPDLSELVLPRWFPLVFALAIAGTFVSGYLGLVATAFASAFFFAYMLVGLAIIHHVTRGMGGRPMILTALYMALVLLNPLSGLAVSLVGVAEPMSPLSRWRNRPPPPS